MSYNFKRKLYWLIVDIRDWLVYSLPESIGDKVDDWFDYIRFSNFFKEFWGE